MQDRSDPGDALNPHLLPGEVIRWRGRPKQGLFLTRRDGILIPFSLLWCGFAVFWEAGALRGNAPTWFALFGMPFVLSGVYLVIGRFVADAWLRSRMIYAITDRRVLIVRRGPWPSVKAVDIRSFAHVTFEDGAHGRGTITFGMPVLVPDGEGGRRHAWGWTPALDPTPRFLGIEDARGVFAAIETRRQSLQIGSDGAVTSPTGRHA